MMAVIALTVFLLMLPSVPQGRTQAPVYPSAVVLVEVHESVAYDLYGNSVSRVYGSVNGTISPIDYNTAIQVITNIQTPSANLTYLLVNGSLTKRPEAPIQGIGYVTYTIVLPADTASFQFSTLGSTTGLEFLWRYVGNVPFIEVTGLSVSTSYVTRLLVPSGNTLSQEYGPTGGALPLAYTVSQSGESGYSSYTLTQPEVSIVVLQSNVFLPASIGVTSATLVIIALAALGLFGQGRLILQRLKRNLLDFGSILHLPSLRRFRPGFRLRNLFRPRKLLVLFVLCALVMVSLAAVAGPDPRVKAYVIADSSSVSGISTSLSSVASNVVAITPAEDYSDFAVMSSVGEFKMVVISHYPSAGLPEVSAFVLASLGNVPIIVYDNSADATFVNQIRDLYPNGLILHVQSAADLNGTEKQELGILLSLPAAVRLNVLGLNISVDGFEALLILEAVLSFVLVFIGFAYLGSLTSESGSQRDLAHLVTVVTSGIFVFVFSEVIYVVTSSLLAMPLSLHAVVSGAHNITAVGILGFGGGSDPRLAAGVLGVIVGAVAVEGGLKVRVPDAALVGGIVLVLLANPFSIGQYVFQALMEFVPASSNLHTLGAAYSSTLTLKGLLYGIGGFFGGNVSPQYLLSAGKILFFAGLVPLAYLKKMGRTTTVLALIAVAAMIGDGGIRVGEMTPDKTFIAIMPGIVAGFAFVAVLLALALAEKYVRGNWRSRA